MISETGTAVTGFMENKYWSDQLSFL